MTKTFKKLHKEKILVWLLSAGIVSMAILYMFLVNGAVFNVVAREDMENQLATINARVSELEFEYIGLRNSITIQYAYDRGFRDVTNAIFAERTPRSNLSINTAE